MIIKKFQGKTEEEAVQKAKEVMGNNVVIMNTKSIKQKGFFKFFSKPVIEVTAALEEVYEDSCSPITEKNQAERAADFIATISDAQNRVKEKDGLEEKLDSLQSLLMQQLHQEEEEEKEKEKAVKQEGEKISEEHLAITKLIYNKYHLLN